MKPIRTIVLSTLLASLLLTAAACNKGQTVGEDPIQSAIHESTLSASAATVTVESETTLLRSSCHTPTDEAARLAAEEAARLAAEEASRLPAKAESIREEAERAASAAAEAAQGARKKPDVAQTSSVTQLQKPPTALLQYQFVLRETTIPQEDELRLVHVSYLHPCTYSWTVEDANGTPALLEQDNGRPCDYEKTARLRLSQVADSDYLVDFQLNEKWLESYTLMAYPIDNDQNGVPCTVKEGKLELFQTPHYYELTVEYTQGTVYYGFFVE